MTIPDFFISYSSKDVEFVAKLHRDLEASGLSIWRDKEQIRGTARWPQVIHEALNICKYMIVVLSPNSMASKEVEAEWLYFSGREKPILCVWLQDCSVHYKLDSLQRADFRVAAKYDVALANFINECKYLLQTGHGSSHVQPRLATSTQQVPVVSPFPDLNWERVAAIAETHTVTMLGKRYRDRFSTNYYLQRPDILNYFTQFIDSDKKLMVLTGPAGVGKSSFICSMITSLPPGNIVFLQDCASLELPDSTSIDDYLREIFRFEHSAIDTFAYGLDASNRMILLFDAVNENLNRDVLLQKLSAFVIALSAPNVKVLVTARTPIWNSIKRHLVVPTDTIFQTAGHNSFVNIQPFSGSELPQVYELYRNEYHIKTSYEELSQQSKYFFSQPLFLKLTAEAYKTRELPKTLVMETVFGKYVSECLGPGGEEAPEYSVLHQAISIMYARALRELEVGQLKLSPGDERFQSYRNLVDKGLFSERKNPETFAREVEMMFVTYERVFEFLLGQLAVGTLTKESLLRDLALARSIPFIQLRGALELLLCFRIVKTRSYDLVIDLAREDQSDNRQFLIDVIRAVYDTGDRELAASITARLAQDDRNNSKMVAVQAAYSLKMDDLLTQFALSDDDVERDIASIYLYQRWNRARLDGNVLDGYKILDTIVGTIKLHNPMRARRGITALLSLSANLLSHLVDDPASLAPLTDIFKSLVRKIPGLEPKANRNIILRFTIDKTLSAVTFAFAYIVNQVINRTYLNDEQGMKAFFGDPRNGRALMDSSMFWHVDDLLGERDKLFRLATWSNDMPAIQIRGPILYHMYHTPEKHFDFLEELFHDVMATGHIQGTVHLAAAMVHAFECRVLRGEEVLEEHLKRLEDIIVELWYFIDEQEETGETIQNTHTLVAYFVIEAVRQKRAGEHVGSKFLRQLIAEYGFDLRPKHVETMLLALEQFAYSGYPDFAVNTVLDPKIRAAWDPQARPACIKLLANLRAFYQEEIDSHLLDVNNPALRELWDSVRASNSMPNVKDIFATSFNMWLVATSVVPLIMKLGGIIIFDLSSSKSMKEFLDRALRTMLSALFDYNVVDIGFTEWFRAHMPGWDNLEKFDIPRTDFRHGEYAEIYTASVARIQDYIDTVGRGIYFDEL